jgi:hypothetical protein
MGHSYNKATKEEVEKVRKLVGEGLTRDVIRNRMNLKSSHLHGILKALGLECPGRDSWDFAKENHRKEMRKREKP